MLTPGIRRGYWCECWTEDVTGRQEPAFVASFDADTPPQADGWVEVVLRAITPMLDADAYDQAWDWLYDKRIDTRRALINGEPCTVTVTQADIRVTWTIRSVRFLPLAHRQAVQLPACVDDFKPHRPY